MNQPKVIVFAGPNGIGKTTFAKQYLDSIAKRIEFVNADEMEGNESASRLFLKRITVLSSRLESFAIESTLSGRSLAKRLQAMRRSGYHVRLIYLWGVDIEETKQRIHRRVLEGGHDIPESVVDRRFMRSYQNFVELYSNCCDAWELYDAKTSTPRIIRFSSDDFTGRSLAFE